MSDSCLTCGSLIMEPNTAYGYAGPTCQCFEEPKIRKRISETMTTTKTPREYWISKISVSTDELNESHPEYEFLKKHNIHVIEKSAYDEALAKAETANKLWIEKKNLQAHADELAEVIEKFLDPFTTLEDRSKTTLLIDLKDALEKYRGRK